MDIHLICEYIIEATAYHICFSSLFLDFSQIIFTALAYPPVSVPGLFLSAPILFIPHPCPATYSVFAPRPWALIQARWVKKPSSSDQCEHQESCLCTVHHPRLSPLGQKSRRQFLCTWAQQWHRDMHQGFRDRSGHTGDGKVILFDEPVG